MEESEKVVSEMWCSRDQHVEKQVVARYRTETWKNFALIFIDYEFPRRRVILWISFVSEWFENRTTVKHLNKTLKSESWPGSSLQAQIQIQPKTKTLLSSCVRLFAV